MSKLVTGIRQTWRSAQLYIGFHRDPKGNQRAQEKVWPPKNGNASIHPDPDTQEAFIVVKAADKDAPRDVQIKLHPNKIVLRRDPGVSWEGIVVDDYMISVQVGGAWVRISADGSISHERDGDMTYVEPDGAVLKKTEFVEAMMSGNGVELSRRTPTTIAAISKDGVIAKSRE
ncbi:hypothetical protein [Aliiroseovarius lamellibrachiae]|uniref:hypothetical protein n=1 Tax=Aliiroseovarius lamellibrachiae TaxID=1924933 RepID=UPI001BE02791|nr:hypothetical protein [Aliiroseovarius lamellibrachiae]MBT2132657.1 hypothetical protein [Aliiroseovarius lamellibrachiae]